MSDIYDVNESLFIDMYIKKSYRERLLFECVSIKKRKRFYSRFAHNSKDILDDTSIILETEKLTTSLLKEIFNKLKLSIYDKAKIFSEYNERESLQLEQVISILDESYFECIAMFNNGLAIVKEETSIGIPMKYILFKHS